MAEHPYQKLPEAAFWRTAVANQRHDTISGLWEPKWSIEPTERIATFGSCFAQHISRALVARNFNWFDAEPPTGSAPPAPDRNYGVFSARTGNIYTAAALRQWVEWAAGIGKSPDEIWQQDDRFFDPFRPTIEPNGFSSPEELLASRAVTLRAIRDAVVHSQHFFFTLGLTEAWVNAEAGYTYAVCPGTIGAGKFDPAKHVFKNFNYPEILHDMEETLAIMRSLNPRLNVLLTVSPVPLTATASGKHVLVATTYSKSVLRAVSGRLADGTDWIDYFPSYEIITGAPFRAQFYETNLRSVSEKGVAFVMNAFFKAQGRRSIARDVLPARDKAAIIVKPLDQRTRGRERRDLQCDEELLEAFAPRLAADQHIGERPDSDALKVCVIGDSHMTALKRALNEGLFANPKMDIIFWGIGGREFCDIQFENGLLTHPKKALMLQRTGGRYEDLPVREFDVLLFVGEARVGQQVARWRQTAARKNKTFFDFHEPDALLNSPIGSLIKAVAPEYRGKMFFAPAPLRSDRIMTAKPELVARTMKRPITTAEWQHVNQSFGLALRKLNVTYVPQPPDTITGRNTTKSEYSTGRDNMHMNGKYGTLIWNTVQEQLQQSVVQRPN